MYVSQATGILKSIRIAASIAMQHGEGFSAMQNGKNLATQALLEAREQIDKAIEELQGDKPVQQEESNENVDLTKAVHDDEVDVTVGPQKKKSAKQLPAKKPKVKPKVKPKIRPANE